MKFQTFGRAMLRLTKVVQEGITVLNSLNDVVTKIKRLFDYSLMYIVIIDFSMNPICNNKESQNA